jgi:hypothetical protein
MPADPTGELAGVDIGAAQPDFAALSAQIVVKAALVPWAAGQAIEKYFAKRRDAAMIFSPTLPPRTNVSVEWHGSDIPAALVCQWWGDA